MEQPIAFNGQGLPLGEDKWSKPLGGGTLTFTSRRKGEPGAADHYQHDASFTKETIPGTVVNVVTSAGSHEPLSHDKVEAKFADWITEILTEHGS